MIGVFLEGLFLLYGSLAYRAGHLFSLLEFSFGFSDSGVGITGVIGSCIFHLSRQIYSGKDMM